RLAGSALQYPPLRRDDQRSWPNSGERFVVPIAGRFGVRHAGLPQCFTGSQADALECCALRRLVLEEHTQPAFGRESAARVHVIALVALFPTATPVNMRKQRLFGLGHNILAVRTDAET